MKEIHVHSSSHSYPIFIGENIRFRINTFLKKEYSSILIITDEKVAELYIEDLVKGLPTDQVYHSIIPSGEQSKNINAFYQLHTEALQFGLDRQSLIIAFGGGVVGDLAGFVAATFMRGIDYIQVPTTILAHDSSVGGKVAINHELGKNLIGNFYPPVSVIYDITTLHSLTEKEIRSGYAELIKEALIANEAFFHTIMHTNLDELSNVQLQEHIQAGIKIKASIVELDEKEAGIRKHLNLGHTLGHAIEAELGYGSLSHGEAVAIGLLFSLHISEDMYSINLPYKELLSWLQINKYPLDVLQLDENALIQKMKSDKKAVNKKIQMVLLKKIGEPVTVNITEQELQSYLKSFIRKLVGE